MSSGIELLNLIKNIEKLESFTKTISSINFEKEDYMLECDTKYNKLLTKLNEIYNIIIKGKYTNEELKNKEHLISENIRDLMFLNYKYKKLVDNDLNSLLINIRINIKNLVYDD